MSRHLLAILLSELKTVRVTCPKCQAVIELTVEQMGFRLGDCQCPVCKDGWPGLSAGDNQSHLGRLGRALHALQTAPGAAQVEFVVDDPGAAG